MAAASAKHLLLLLLAALGLAAAWPMQGAPTHPAANNRDTTAVPGPRLLAGHRRLLAATSTSTPATPDILDLSADLQVPFMFTGDRQYLAGRAQAESPQDTLTAIRSQSL
jgi:hypothetical protein